MHNITETARFDDQYLACSAHYSKLLIAQQVKKKKSGADSEAFGEPFRKSCRQDLLLSRCDIVGDTVTPDLQGIGIPDDKAGSGVAVAGLTDAAHVEKIFLVFAV
jgi:hypothetical protein